MRASPVGNVTARDPLNWKARTTIILQIAEGMFLFYKFLLLNFISFLILTENLICDPSIGCLLFV